MAAAAQCASDACYGSPIPLTRAPHTSEAQCAPSCCFDPQSLLLLLLLLTLLHALSALLNTRHHCLMPPPPPSSPKHPPPPPSQTSPPPHPHPALPNIPPTPPHPPKHPPPHTHTRTSKAQCAPSCCLHPHLPAAAILSQPPVEPLRLNEGEAVLKGCAWGVGGWGWGWIQSTRDRGHVSTRCSASMEGRGLFWIVLRRRMSPIYIHSMILWTSVVSGRSKPAPFPPWMHLT